MDIDLDVVRNRVGTRPGKLRSMVAILLAGELGVELHDPAVDCLQLQDLRGRGLPLGKRHTFEIVQNDAGVHGVGLGPLHARPAKILHRPRIDHHHFHVLGMVQGERELQAVDSGRFQTDPHRPGTLGRPTNEFLVPARAVRKPRQRQPLPSAPHHAHQRFRIYIDSDLVDLFHSGSRITLTLRFPRPCTVAKPTL